MPSGSNTDLVWLMLKVSGESQLKSISDKFTLITNKARTAARNVGAVGTSLRTAAREGTDAYLSGMDDFKATLEILTGAIEITHNLLASNKKYDHSVRRAKEALTNLGDQIANYVGPTVATWIDNFTLGLTYIVEIIKQSVIPAIDIINETFIRSIDLAKRTVEILVLFAANEFEKAGEKVAEHYAKQVEGRKVVLSKIADLTKIHVKGMEIAYKQYLKNVNDEYKKTDAEIAAIEKAAEERSKKALQAQQLVVAGRQTAASLGQAADSLGATQTRLQELKVELPANTATDALNAASGGLGSVLAAAGGPIGAAVAAALPILQDPSGFLQNIFDEIWNIAANLPDLIGIALSKTIPSMIRLLPTLITNLMKLAPAIILELVKALPLLMLSIVEALVTFLPTMMKHFVILIKSIPKEIGKAVGDAVSRLLTGPLTNKEGKFIFGTNLGREAETKRILGVKLPSLDTGGTVTQSGLVMAHRGEHYGGVSSGRSTGMQTTNNSFGNIIIQSNNVDDIFRRFRQLQGSFGTGVLSTPLVNV